MSLFASPAPFVRSFSFPDGEQRVGGGCAVVVARADLVDGSGANQDGEDEFVWDQAQTAAFFAGEPVTLGWVSPSPAGPGRERAYVCCWVTVNDE